MQCTLVPALQKISSQSNENGIVQATLGLTDIIHTQKLGIPEGMESVVECIFRPLTPTCMVF